MLFAWKEKDLTSKFTQLSSVEISEDQQVEIWHVCTYWLKQNLSPNIPESNPKIARYVPFKPPYLPIHEITLSKDWSIYQKLPVYL